MQVFECIRVRGGGAKNSWNLKKNYLKYLYKFETLVTFEVPPLATGCSNPSTDPNAGNIV